MNSCVSDALRCTCILKDLFIYSFYVYEFLLTCMHSQYMHDSFLWRPKEGIDPLELKLQMAVSHHMGSENKKGHDQ